jgi:hypothetical protein
VSPQGSLGLRFVLEGGSFVDVVLPAAAANAVVHNFESGHYRLKDVKWISGTCLSGVSYCVDSARVQAVHTVRLDLQPQALKKSFLSGNN